MQLHEMSLTLISLSLPNPLDHKLTKLMSYSPGEQTRMGYVGDVLNVIQTSVV